MTGRHLAAVPDQLQSLRPAVLYVRVSALMGRGGDSFLSPEIQVGTMRRALPMHGLREVREPIEDLDVSGATFEREGLEKVLALADARKIDVLVCYDTSRFGRDVLESLLFLRDLAKRGVHIIAITEGIDTSTDHGMSMLVNMLNVAEMRRREIGRAWRNTIAARARAGRWHGKVPHGMRKRDDGHLEPDPLTGPAVREAFRSYGADDIVRQARRTLCAALGTSITESGFKRLLRNEAYRGVVEVSGIRVEHAHEPLIDDVMWQRVQRRLARDATTPSRVLGATHSVTGLAKCGRCGGTAGVTAERPSRGRGVFCYNRRQGPGTCAGCGMLTLSYVEDELLREARAYAAKLRGDVAAQAARLATAAKAGADASTLERELATTRTAMVRVTKRWAQDARSDDSVFEQALAELRAAEQQLTRRINELAAVAEGPDPDGVADLADKLVRMWPEMEPHERNRVLKLLVQRIEIAPAGYRGQPARERVTVVWR